MGDKKNYHLSVRMHPGSSKRELVYKNGTVHIYTPKKPVQGKANKDAIKIISEQFGIPKQTIVLKKGKNSREKVFLLEGNFNIDPVKLPYMREV